MDGTDRVSGAPYRRALAALAAVLVVGGASLTSPTILSSHSAPPNNGAPTFPVASATPNPTAQPTTFPPPTVAGTSDVEPTDPTSIVPTVTPVSPTPTVTMTAVPKITVKRVTVPFTTVTKKDPELAKGKTKVVRAGVNGTNELTYTDGKLTHTKVIRKPVAKLVALGTKTANPWISAQKCDVIGGHRPVAIATATVSDPDKVGYRLTITWGKDSQVFTGSGTRSFELRPQQWGWWWAKCQIALG